MIKNISIIEIKSFSDKINFIDLDDSANEDDLGLYYNKETIYIIHLNNKNEYNVSFGILNNITKINIKITLHRLKMIIKKMAHLYFIQIYL